MSSVRTTDELLKDWTQTKQFTLEVADAMPAEFYDFKPTPEEMTFGQQMVHLAGANILRFYQLSGVKPPSDPHTKMNVHDRAVVIKALQQSFDYVLAILPQLTAEQLQKTFQTGWKDRPEPNGRDMILNMFVHTAHHRAQCEVYLRLKGITPPVYMF